MDGWMDVMFLGGGGGGGWREGKWEGRERRGEGRDE